MIGVGVPTPTSTVIPLAITGSALIVMGNGNDGVGFGNTNITGGLSIHVGNGNDTMDVTSSSVHGNVDIQAGDGNDTVFLNGPLLLTAVPAHVLVTPTTIIGPLPLGQILHPATTPTSLTATSQQFQGNVSVTLGKGADSVAIEHTSIVGSLTINTGAGQDIIQVGRPLVVMYTGANASGNDVTIGGILSIISGNGGDQITLNSVKAKIIDVVTGQGADNVSLASTTADAFFRRRGPGMTRSIQAMATTRSRA